MQGGHAAAFNFSEHNIDWPGIDAALFLGNNPFTFVGDAATPPACPRATSDLRSLFIAVFDDDLRLASLAGLGKLPGQQCQ